MAVKAHLLKILISISLCLFGIFLITKATLKDNSTTLTQRDGWKNVLQKNRISVGLSTKDDCALLFKDASVKLDEFVTSLAAKMTVLNMRLKSILKKKAPEGNSGTLKEQQFLYWTLGGLSSVRTICEIGFNAGHSALVWLESNPNVHLYSFDLGRHNYTAPMASFLKENYPNRFDIFMGASDVVVPIVNQKHHISCDILVVDGGHFSNQALKDIVNMKRFAHENSLLIVDDTAFGAKFCDDVMKSVNKLLKCSYIELQFMCQYTKKRRGFALFTYNSYNNDTCVFTL